MIENTYEDQKQKSVDILMKMRELNTFLTIKSYINEKKSLLKLNNLDEFQYCDYNARINVYTELEEFINEKIKILKE